MALCRHKGERIRSKGIGIHETFSIHEGTKVTVEHKKKQLMPSCAHARAGEDANKNENEENMNLGKK